MDKIKNQLRVSVSNSYVDKGDGLVEFPQGLTITDGSIMRSGTRYDISSLNIQDYQGQLTADHFDSLGTLIGKVNGVRKEGDRVVVNSIDYAVKQNPYARLAYDLLVGGYSNSFSIETMGPYPDEGDRTYRNHELVGLSQVVVPNNYNAKTNQFNEIVHNSLERSQQDGLDITGVEEKIFSSIELKSTEPVKEESMTKTETDTSKVEEVVKTDEAEVVTPEQVEEAAKEETKVETVVDVPKPEEKPEEEEPVTPPAPVKVEANAETETPKEVKTEEVKTEEVKTETKTETKPAEEAEEEKVENKTNKTEEKLQMTKEEFAELLANAMKPLQEDVAAAKELAQNALDTQAKEPEFKEEKVVKSSLDGLDADEMFAKQLNAAVASERMHSVEGRRVLDEINARNLQALKDEKIVNAAMTLEDLGNFIIGPELYNQVATKRTVYTALVDATNWKETNSIEFGWLTRSSDIDMQNVAIGALGDVPSPDTTDNRLKPVSTPGYGAHTDKLEEMAAVTPISINVIKFAAVDILSDVAEGYRNDYDRKRAQLVVARLQQAVNATGNKWNYDISDGIIGWAQVVALISDVTTVGTLVFNSKTLAALKGQAISTQNASILTEISNGSILGTPFILVPNDLLPTLNTTQTKTFKVYGQNVTIDSAVFYGDMSTFTGRTSGGLKYDVAAEASYEMNGEVYSAYQRNEIVLRGSFFRGGVVKDTSVIAAIPAVAVS